MAFVLLKLPLFRQLGYEPQNSHLILAYLYKTMQIIQNNHGKIELTLFAMVPQEAYLFLAIMVTLKSLY